MSAVAIIQARMTSTRLPGKVLMEVGGLPIVALAGLRSANKGRKVIIATSTDPSDDLVSVTAHKFGFPVYRGSLHNVLSRFVHALEDYGDDQLFFRLTADNVFPDGSFLDSIEDYFLRSGLEYLACNGERCGLPYGLSAELTRVGHLRKIYRSQPDEGDREHVTLSIANAFATMPFTELAINGSEYKRCTIDTAEDYHKIRDLFLKIENPVEASWRKLVDLL